MVEVVGALIFKDGKFMICKRPPEKSRGLLWEFVGGKVEKGESKKDALIRECREELDVLIDVKEEFMSNVHVYSDVTVCLTVFTADIITGTPKLLEHIDIKWISPCETDKFDFCPADYPILEKIKSTF